MDEFTVMVAEFGSPFPSKVFEMELSNIDIEYRIFQKQSSEGGIDSNVFYVKSEDVEKAIEIRERVEKEDEQSKIKYRHPIVKVIGYLGIAFVFYLLTSNLSELFS